MDCRWVSRTAKVVVFLVTVSCAMDPLFAADRQLTAAEKELEKHLLTELKADDHRTIAAFDHKARTWTVLRWDGSLHPVGDPKEAAEILLERSEKLRTYIINTNPLVYNADRTATAQTNIESLEQLQKLVAGLGGLVTKSIGNVGKHQADEMAAKLRSDAEKEALRGTSSTESSAARALRTERIFRTWLTVVERADEFLAQLNKTIETLPKDQLTAVKDATALLVGPIQQVDGARLVSWLQATESNLATANRPDKPTEVAVADLLRDFNALGPARTALATKLARVPCTATISAVSTVVEIRRNALPAEGAVAVLDRYRRTLALLDPKAKADQTCTAEMRAAADDVRLWLEASPPSATPPSGVEEAQLRRMADELVKFIEDLATYAAALDKAKEIQASETKVVTAASTLSNVLGRTKLVCPSCDAAMGVIFVERSSFSGDAFPWTKIRKDTVTVSADPGLKDKLTLTHPSPAEGSFTAEQAAAKRLQLDVAVINTDLYSPSFAAGVDPDDSGPLLPKIKETDRSSRSGKLALMGAYRWPIGTGKVSAGLQIGVAIDTDDPGFFVGPTLRWGFVALGWGYTLQSVKELNGQIVGQDLAKGDVVKLRDHWQDDTFWSLSISLRNLPFFKGKG